MELNERFMNKSLFDHALSGVIVWVVSTFFLLYRYRADVAVMSSHTLIWFAAGVFASALGLGVFSYVVSEIVIYFAGLAVRILRAALSLGDEAAIRLMAGFSVISFAIFALASFVLVKKAFVWYLTPL